MRLNDGQCCSQFFSKSIRKALANVGPKDEPIATSSTCLWRFPLELK